MEIQAVYFDITIWDAASSRKWLKSHNLVPIKRMRIEGTHRRYRIQNPNKYRSFITKKLPGGVYLVLGK